MADHITYEIVDSAGRTYFVTTDMMDEENLWYRGNTDLFLSVDGTQHIDRNRLISNSRLVSYPGDVTTYATIVSVRAVGTTSGVQTGWYTYAVLALLVVFAAFTLFRKGRRAKSWKSY